MRGSRRGEDFDGTIRILPDTATASDNRAYVLCTGQWRDGTSPQNEVLIFRFSEHDRWELARRFPTEREIVPSLVLPDGTVLDIHGIDGINAHLPDGTLHPVELQLGAPGVKIRGPRRPTPVLVLHDLGG